MAALLEQPGVAGMRVLQALQRRERLGHALQVAQGDGAHVEQVAVRRGVRQQAIGGRPALRRSGAARSVCCTADGMRE